ncbi:MAG: transposase, partial [Gammaproteobacteria bacterium]|nr:transposase [Gammaproteobacteria bacterium]
KRVKDIRQNRREERERVRKAEAWELAEHPGTPRKIGGGSQSNASASSSAVESRKRGFLNILKQTRKSDEHDNPTS